MEVVLDKPILITGGCGFVGRNVARRMLELGHDVVLIDDLSTGIDPARWLGESYHRQTVESGLRGELFSGERQALFLQEDFLNVVRMSDENPFNLFSTGYFDYCFHFAAVVGGRAKIDGDPLAVSRDLALDAEFFRWAVACQPEHCLYASSSAAYPTNLQSETDALMLREDMIDFESGNLGQPDMTYGWSKLTGEYLGRIAADQYSLKVVSVRPFSGYGEDQEPVYPIPAIARRAAMKEDPLTIWGSGRQGRDFVHIDDCVDLMWLAVNKITDGSAVNIGTEKLTTFLEVASLFAELAGYEPEIKPLIDKPVGVHSRYCSIDRARELLGWQPRISLKEGFERVLRHVEATPAVM